MEWLRNWSWRLTIIVLPWQTRLMFSDASIYVSWLLMLLSIFFAFQSRRSTVQSNSRHNAWMGIVLLLLIFASAVTTFPTGTWQWWIQVLLLGLFGWSLVISKVDAREFLVWNVIALVPHALLAFQQAITQQVMGTKWFGIASQLPETRGVAVVDVNGVRYLRAYGGMPYPNILGGYLALGLPVSLWLAYRNKFWIAVSCLFTVALVLTHSRSAWIAGVALIIIFLWNLHRSRRYALRAMRAPLLFVLCSLLAVLLWQWPLLMTRVTGEGRLEVRSITERVSGIQAGLTVFSDHPWFGVGRNALSKTADLYPLPHNVFLLALAETGLVGIAGTIVLLIFAFRSLSPDKRKRLILASPFIIIAMVDHYLWSYWSGQTLILLSVTWILLESQHIDKTANS